MAGKKGKLDVHFLSNFDDLTWTLIECPHSPIGTCIQGWYYRSDEFTLNDWGWHYRSDEFTLNDWGWHYRSHEFTLTDWGSYYINHDFTYDWDHTTDVMSLP